LVENAWFAERGCPIAGLAKVKDDSITFNREVFGDIFKRKRS
jgi:hypothetical protein